MDGEPESAREGALEQWMESISAIYDLIDLALPDDVVLDYSGHSLERFVDVLDDVVEVPDFDEAAAAYIGQTLLVLAGGQWGWDDSPDSDTFGQPLVLPSPLLGIMPVAPMTFVRAGSAAIVETYVSWEETVHEYAAAHPDWRPVKACAPGLDRCPDDTAGDDRHDRLAQWLADREQRFPQWVAAYGADGRWDFSALSLHDLTAVLFRVTPTPAQFEDASKVDFVEGAAWYLGETLRRAEPGEWIDTGDVTHFQVRKHPSGEWSLIPQVDLRGAVRDGNLVRLHNVFGEWTTPRVSQGHPEPEYRWTGTTWQTPLDIQVESWVESIAARIAALAAAVPDIILDFSAASLRRLEVYCRAAGSELGQDLLGDIAAYLGEALLRVQGGNWTIDTVPSNVSLGRPVIKGDNYQSDLLSPIDLVLVACRWPDTGALTHSYAACDRFATAWTTRDPSWCPTKTPTPGLEPAPPPSAVEFWCAARESHFSVWAARYGAGRTWDFSRDSLIDLADVVLATVPTEDQFRDPQHAAFIDDAAWYYGEVLRRGKPSHWDHDDQLDPDDRWHLHVSALGRDAGFPLSVFVVQDLFYMVAGPIRDGRHFWPADLIEHRPTELRRHFDSWLTAAFRQRAQDALRRRGRKKSRRKQSDADYVITWTTLQAQRFPQWRQLHGTELGRDFSPESLDVLESILRQVTPTPEEMLEDTGNAEFINVAMWYYGETMRRATDLAWTYDRGYGPDCYLRDENTSLDPIYDLAGIFSHYDTGSLRRHYDRRTR